MEDLKRLVRIISKRKQRQYPLLELKSINDNSSKENIFFRYIKKGIVESDDDASNLIYGTSSQDDRYRMLKSRLKQKLLNHTFFLDFTDSNQKVSHQYEQECVQQLHQAKMLLFTSEKKIAKSLVLKALTTAERGEFTKHIVASLEELVGIYSNNCQPHLFDNTIEQLEKVRVLYAKEQAARERYYYIKMMVVKSVNSRKKNLEKTTEEIDLLYKLWKETNSYNIFEYFYKLKLLYLELIGDFESIIPFLTEINTGKFEGKEINPYRLDKRHIAYSQAYAYLRSKDLKKGLEYAEQQLELFDPNSSNWFSYMENYFLLAMHGVQYQKAFQIIDQVFESKLFLKLSPDARERWKLYNAYLHYAYSGNFYMRNFNYASFLEQVPEYDKDKEGFNVAVLILQFLYYVERGELKSLIERRDALKKYMANHFKENFSYRTRTFFKLLNIVVENSLDIKMVQMKSRYLINKMQETPVVGDAFTEIEIIPYEHLWDLMLNMIKYQRIRQF